MNHNFPVRIFTIFLRILFEQKLPLLTWTKNHSWERSCNHGQRTRPTLAEKRSFPFSAKYDIGRFGSGLWNDLACPNSILYIFARKNAMAWSIGISVNINAALLINILCTILVYRMPTNKNNIPNKLVQEAHNDVSM